MGWMTPVSLFANMMLTSFVLGRSAASSAAGSMRPCGVQGRKVTSMLARVAERFGGVEDGVMLDGGGDEVLAFGSSVPKRARLSLSVPPEVKTISEARQWRRRATDSRA